MKIDSKASIVFVSLFMIFISCNNDDNQIDAPSMEKEATEELPANEPPSSFDLIKVIEDEIVLNLSPTFSWEKAEDPEDDTVTYDFYLAKKEEELKVAVANLSDTILDYGLSFSEEYNWKVVAKDSKGGSTESETFSFSTRDLNVPIKITDQTLFGGRTGHSVVSFKNRLLLINGSSEEILGLPKPEKDLWYSDNVTDWTMVGDTAAFAHRNFCTPLKFKEKLYIIGGASSKPTTYSDISDYKNDVWASTDGLYWQKVQTHATFSPRTGHSLVVFKEKMWMFGGIDENGIHHNDLYVSDDGVVWSSINMSNQGLTPRAYAKFVVFNDKLYLIGGRNNSSLFNEIWESDNGTDWSLIKQGDEVPVHILFDAFVYRNKIILINHLIDEDKIWYSADAKIWLSMEGDNPLSRREGSATVLHNDQIYIFGGRDIDTNNSVGERQSDIWVFN